jgi:transcriptional regulator with XRE-family HTH domain
MRENSVNLIEDVKAYAVVNNLSRAQLAKLLGVSQSSIDKFLGGFAPPSTKLIKKISIKTGIEKTRSIPFPDFGISNLERASVAHLEGSYQVVRPSFRETGCFHTYVIDVKWDAFQNTLVFDENNNELAPLNKGVVSLPVYNRMIYFLSCENGNFRLMVLSDAYQKGIFYGGLITVGSPKMSVKTPTAAIVVLKKATDGEELAFGTIRPDHPRFAEFQALIHFGRDEGFFIAHP